MDGKAVGFANVVVGATVIVLTLVEETMTLVFKLEVAFAEVTARATKASVKGAVMARPRKRAL